MSLLTKKPPLWVILITTLLGAHFIGILIMVRIATKNASGGVIPDYYTQAVNWDKLKADQQASDALNWSLSIVPSTTPDPQGNRLITLYLSDSAKSPIDKANITLTAHPITRPDLFTPIPLVEIQPGEYQGKLPAPHPGKWTFDIVASKDTSKYIHWADSYFSNR
jgi:nitrogen fixation protein FixH